MTCVACPFALSAESENGINLGCLPDPTEIRRMKRDADVNWTCHEDESRLCAGFVSDCKERGVDYRIGRSGSYTRWYHEGAA